MARLRRRPDAPSKDPCKRRHGPWLDFLMGPTDAPGEYTAEELEVLWPLYRDEVMGGPNGRPDGRRPWAWWEFEAREPMPRSRWNPETGRMGGWADETVRLAELGELTDEELAAFRDDADEARLRIGMGAERISGGWRNSPSAVSMDQRAVELWEQVEAALGKR